ncbi:maleylpyruvate isomerase N-terminal domain-containing protein, partial [Streptomyces sp. NPDC055078]
MGRTAADEHRTVAGAFTDRVRGTGREAWDNPAPCEGWTARDVVRHLVEWFPGFLKAGAGVELPKGPSADDDPVAAWTVHRDGVQALLDDPATAHRLL